MKPFNLEAAKRGEPIVTRGGEAAKFIAHVPDAEIGFRVVVMLDGVIECYCDDGSYRPSWKSTYDLFMATRKRTVWMNVYPTNGQGGCYDSEIVADRYAWRDRIGNRAWPLEIED